MTDEAREQMQLGDEDGPEPNPEPPAERQAENWGRIARPDDDDGHDDVKGRRRI